MAFLTSLSLPLAHRLHEFPTTRGAFEERE